MSGPHALAAAILAGALGGVLAVAGLAALLAEPNAGAGTRLALFPPAFSGDRALAAIIAAGARPVRRTALDPAWVVDVDAGGARGLKQAGALLVLDDVPFGPALAGCIITPALR